MTTKMMKVKSPEFRVSFPSVFKPKAFGTAEPKFSVTMLFKKSRGDAKRSEDLAELVKALNLIVSEEWPNADSRPKKILNPIKDGDTDEMEDGTLRCDKYPEMRGHWVVSAFSKQRPGVIDADGSPLMTEEEFYSGCYAKATLTCFAYKPGKGREQSKTGVGFGLQNLLKTRDGERFSGRARAEDDFKNDIAVGGASSEAGPAASGGSDNMFG